ncbi:MAG: type I glutamate--ammonia ligase, partial [Ruminococcus sp.]|nr:type I glutamate--ammonia ligase [Ruminococcus sp.]
SYERLGEFSAPRDIIWSDEEGSQLIRMAPDSDNTCVELRAADCVCEPHFVIGLVIYSALDGISEKLELPPKNSGSERLPSTLEEAMNCAEASLFVKKHIPANILEVLLRYRREEWREYTTAYDKEAFEDKKYFYNL